MRVMFNMPLCTHKFFIEPISETEHLKFVLLDRFIKFRDQVMRCAKSLMKLLFNTFQHNSNTAKGKNMRNIMILCNKNDINDLTSSDLDSLIYKNIPRDEEWKIGIVQELLETKEDPDTLLGFTFEEVDHILHDICVS